MEYTYATLLLNELDEELNEENLTTVLEAAGCAVQESRVKALVAALEGVEVDDIGPADIDATDDLPGDREPEAGDRNAASPLDGVDHSLDREDPSVDDSPVDGEDTEVSEERRDGEYLAER